MSVRSAPALLAFPAAWLAGLLLAATTAKAQPGSPESYRIGPRDQLQIRVAELPDLDTERVVAEDGTLELPVIGTLIAQGLTESELAIRIRTRLEADGLRRATVTVTVTGYRSRPVSLLGAVVQPGNKIVPARTTLLDLLIGAGGLDSDHGPVIQVRRVANSGLSGQVEIPVVGLLETGDPRYNIPIFAGDMITVPAAREVTVHLLGEVASAGSLIFPAGSRVTLLAAIARAGGLTETASKRIRILRETPSGERRELFADYRRLLSGRDADIELEDGDVVVVKESFF